MRVGWSLQPTANNLNISPITLITPINPVNPIGMVGFSTPRSLCAGDAVLRA